MPNLPSPGRTPLGIYHLKPGQPVWPDFPAQGDALDNPELDDIAQSFYGLLPVGAAWRAPDGAAFEAGTMLGRFWRALAGDFVTLYRRLFRISQESTAATLIDSLEDWEAEFGLPDPCFGNGQNRTQRLRALMLKVRSKGTITKTDFINLAASAGYVVTIREPLPFAFARLHDLECLFRAMAPAWTRVVFDYC